MRIVEGDIFDDDADVLVLPVNCVGAMGKGLAREAKRRWPDVHASYQALCRRKGLKPGGVWGLKVYPDGATTFLLLLAATKDHWRGPSQIGWVAAICAQVGKLARTHPFSIAVPALGCGEGGLDWDEVRPIMEHHFADQDIRVYPPGQRATEQK